MVLGQLERYREDVPVGTVTLRESTKLFAKFGLIPIAGLIVIVSLIKVLANLRDQLNRTRAS